MERRHFSSESEVASAIVDEGIAPVAAVGWAIRREGGWKIGIGGATLRIFDLASLTKPMTALAFARSSLAAARLAPLMDVLHEARDTPSASVPIELFLAHRSGLEAHVPLYAPLEAGGVIDRDTALRAAAKARRPDATGEAPLEGFAPIYSDLGYLLVGEALARSQTTVDAGEAIERLVVDALEGPPTLGTARTLATRIPSWADRVVPTEVVPWRGGEVRGVVHDENAWAMTERGGSGHAGMFGTVDAVLAFACAAYDAIVLSSGPLAAGDLRWLVRERPGSSLRAGFDGKSVEGSSAGERASLDAFGHLGFTGTSMWLDPVAKTITVLLTNRVHPTRENIAIRAARPIVHDALFDLAAKMTGDK